MAQYLGVDRAGDEWVAIVFDDRTFDEAVVTSEIGGVWSRYEERAERVLVDVPIGLVGEGEHGRECDRLAREVVGPRSDSVFTPPVREATRKRRYPAAKRVNERKTGSRLSEQAFESSDAIAAVDQLLQEIEDARAVFAESHPEVCFRAFAGEHLEHPKRTAGGYAERMRALAQFDSDAPPVVQRVAESSAGVDVAVADVLDAVALTYTARPGPGRLRSLPPDPPLDGSGLSMGIRYRAEESLVS